MPRKPHDADSSRFPYKGPVSPTSTGLILRIKDGESAAWERFMMLYTPLIRHWCKKPGGRLNRQDRQDIAQEVLARVNKAIGEFDEKREGRSLRAWLRTITQNVITDHLEYAAKRLPVSRLMSDTGHIKEPYNKPFDLPEEPNEKTILLRQILKIVKSEFSERDWEMMQLFVFAEKTSSEVAEVFDMKGDTVRRLKNRILKRIREEYETTIGVEEIPDL